MTFVRKAIGRRSVCSKKALYLSSLYFCKLRQRSVLHNSAHANLHDSLTCIHKRREEIRCLQTCLSRDRMLCIHAKWLQLIWPRILVVVLGYFRRTLGGNCEIGQKLFLTYPYLFTSMTVNTPYGTCICGTSFFNNLLFTEFLKHLPTITCQILL
jgi:hypothetical protein